MRHRLLRAPGARGWRWVVGALTLGSRAWAHGSAPSAIEVLAEQAPGQPSIVALSYGLARREPGGTFSFVCPAAWGASKAVAAAAGDLLVVASGGRLLAGRPACAFAPVALDDTVIDVVTTAAGVLALAQRDDRSRVYRVEASGVQLLAEVSWQDPDGGRIDAVMTAPDGSLVATTTSPSPALLRPGATPVRTPVVLPFVAERLVPRLVDGDTVTSLAVGPAGRFLVEQALGPAGAAPVLVGPFATVLGPVRAGATVVAVADGRLWRREESGWSAGPEVPYTCLSQVGPSAYACSLGATVRLEVSGGEVAVADPVFSLAMVGEPSASCQSEAGAPGTCTGDWSHFGAEAGLLDTLPVTSPDGPRRAPAPTAAPGAPAAPAGPGAGCALLAGGSTGGGLPGLLAVLGALAAVGGRVGRHLRPGQTGLERPGPGAPRSR